MTFLQWLNKRLFQKPATTASSARDWHAEITRKYGPYASAFTGDELGLPGYEYLLHLNNNDGNLEPVLDNIATALESPDAEKWGGSLLADSNWRPHLVGAFAALLAKEPAPYIPFLWQAIDGGSWVTPQLVATARIVDPDFSAEVMARVEAGCPVNEPEGLNALERHSATGPGGTTARRAKLLASLLALCDDSEVHEWLHWKRQQPDVLALLAEDMDESGDIACHWHARAHKMFQERRVAR